MSYTENEQERLKRLRDQQIQARDPKKKERQLSRRITARNKALHEQEKHFYRAAAKDVSHKARGIYIGAVVGLVVMILLALFVEGKSVNLISILAIPFFISLGFLIGASLDWRDDMRDLLK
jgi:hypothetical protein